MKRFYPLLSFYLLYLCLLFSTSSCSKKSDLPTPPNPNALQIWQRTEDHSNIKKWKSRIYHSSAVFQGKLWVLGGLLSRFADGEITGDAWSSLDGTFWRKESSSNEWGSRYAHTSLVFNDKIWVIGGKLKDPDKNDTYHYKNDVWSSTDGKTWKEESNNNLWDGRYQHKSIVFDNKIWVLGGDIGSDESSYQNDVWSSTDGKTWTQTTEQAPWSKRVNFAIASFKNQLWVLGGKSIDGSYKNDVWSSTDGKTWKEVTTEADWGSRESFTALVKNDSLYILGGHKRVSSTSNQIGGEVHYNDIWSSADGKTWKLSTHFINAYGKSSHTATVFKNKLWILGGYRFSSNVWGYSNEVLHN